jgi:2TM domain
MENQDAYRRAKRRVEARLGFYWHLGIYLSVNALLVIINLVTSTEYLWFKWPLLGWGIGVFFHGLGVFRFSSGRFATMKERMIEEEMKKESLRKDH